VTIVPSTITKNEVAICVIEILDIKGAAFTKIAGARLREYKEVAPAIKIIDNNK
jgi:hypothetical protein